MTDLNDMPDFPDMGDRGVLNRWFTYAKTHSLYIWGGVFLGIFAMIAPTALRAAYLSFWVGV